MTANPAPVLLWPLATHAITYPCQTSAGDLSSAILTIVVQDSSSPVVTLLGASTVTINIGDTYGSAEDDGATASDNLDGDLTSSIVTSGLPADSSAPGTQLVTYTVVDSRNLSASINRTIAVVNPVPIYSQPFTLARDATGFKVERRYSATSSGIRFAQIELGSFPVAILLLFWSITPYSVFGMPGGDGRGLVTPHQ